MWRNTNPISSAQMRSFEQFFSFRINEPLREFLLTHNAGSPIPGEFNTNIRSRRLERLLDISDETSPIGAWAINRRLRKLIGPKRVILGIDDKGNYLCVSRERKQQHFEIWNHVSDQFEESAWEIPQFLSYVG